MPLTPIDIQQKTFGPELRGYNMDEVDDFLDDVVTALKDYDQRVRDAQDRIRALEAELSTRGEDESAISRALVAAQKQADALVGDAHADADRIRADAQVEADRLRADRDTERMGLNQDIARMRATIADLKRRVAELAASVSDDLDAMDEAAASASTDVGGDLASDPPEVGPAGYAADYEGAANGDKLDVFSRDQEDSPSVADSGAWQRSQDDEVEGTDVWSDAVAEADDEEIDDLDELEGVDADDDLDELDEELDLDEAEEPDAEGVEPDAEATEPPSGRRPWERGSV